MTRVALDDKSNMGWRHKAEPWVIKNKADRMPALKRKEQHQMTRVTSDDKSNMGWQHKAEPCVIKKKAGRRPAFKTQE